MCLKSFRLPITVKVKFVTRKALYSLIWININNNKKIINSIRPGQFFLIYSDGLCHNLAEFVPISVCCIDRDCNDIAFLIKRKGATTKYLANCVNANDTLGIMGPFGNGFDLGKIIGWKRSSYVCGGIGIAPVLPLLDDTSIVYHGLREKGENDIIASHVQHVECLYQEYIDNRELVPMLHCVEHDIVIGSCRYIISCGPELMMKKVLDLCNKYNIDGQFCTERYVKCGRGICGSCCINDQRVCTDGPVFTRDQLNNMPDFGKCYMDQSGERIYYE